MGGDGMGGMAAAIVAAMAFMLLGGMALLFWIGRTVARARGWDRTRARNAGVFGGLVGLGLGALAVAATFFESSWSPPPRLDLNVASNYAQPWTILLEDPRAAATLDFEGSGLPFTQRHASLAVPHNGIVRVRSFGEAMGRADLVVRWSDGSAQSGSGMGPAPASTGAKYFIAVDRGGPPKMLPSDDALARLIAAREGRAASVR